MTIARSAQVCLDETTYYHCTTRCVRGAFLCGFDESTEKDYEHRRALLEERMIFLSKIFGIELFSYAIMSNHYHIVLKIRHDKISTMDDREIIRRWCRLYKISSLIQKYVDGDYKTNADAEMAKIKIAQYRERLASLSWYMKCLNEYVSRIFNKEDNCTGHFWEARFKCHALLNDEAIV